MDKQILQDFIKANPNLVQMRESLRYPGLFVIKYKKRVFYDNLWNDVLEECRGLVVDADFNIISYPFTKIYNYGIEARAPKFSETETLMAYRKVNGFMAALTWYNGDILVSTTGSLDSKFVDYVWEFIDDDIRNMVSSMPNYTLMFECVHRDDPHIIPEAEGLYFLGYRSKEFGSFIWTDPSDMEIYGTISDIREAARTCKHEGYVFYAEDGRAAKIKSPYYLINKFVARNPRTDKLMRPDIKNSLDEEYYPLIDAIQANIEEYTALSEQERLAWVREFFSAN